MAFNLENLVNETSLRIDKNPVVRKVKIVYHQFTNHPATIFAKYWLYTINVEGSQRRERQAEVAIGIGWKEKDLTTTNAVVFGIAIPSLYALGNYLLGDNFGRYIQDVLYGYPGFNFAQSLFRIAYSQITKEAIGSIGVWNGLGIIQDTIKGELKRAKPNKPAEGVEPSTYALQVRCSATELRRHD